MYLTLVKEHLKKHKEKYEVMVASNEYSSVLPSDEGIISQLEKSKKVASYKICSNANITRGSRDNKIGVGRSTIHGWGAFLKNDVNASEFLMEYGGEIISQDEAERRGRIYDKVDSSFLFSLNDEMAVDATRLGSKTKFINHASQPNQI
jgi:SET domain-containing protein